MRFISNSIVWCSKCSYSTVAAYLVLIASGSHPIKLSIPLNTELFADSPQFLMLRCLCPCISPRLEFFPHLPYIFAHLNHTHFYKPISNFPSSGSSLSFLYPGLMPPHRAPTGLCLPTFCLC